MLNWEFISRTYITNTQNAEVFSSLETIQNQLSNLGDAYIFSLCMRITNLVGGDAKILFDSFCIINDQCLGAAQKLGHWN